MGVIGTAWKRAFGAKLPRQEEIERYGADGEEVIYRMLAEQFGCVIRGVVLPWKKKYLEKDFLVIERGVPFVIEVKYWKGEIGMEGDSFFQNKEGGVHKTLKSPVATTKEFISRMKDFYQIERDVCGMVVFADPDCRLSLPSESEGIALLPVGKMISFIKSRAAREKKNGDFPDPDRILRCTRFYDEQTEFCKGIVAESTFRCFDAKGTAVDVDTVRVRFITVRHERLRMRDRLLITYRDESTAVLYNRDTVLHIGCLDGTFCQIALNQVRYIVF